MKGKINNTELLVELGNNIREFRKAKGLSQEKLSELAGLHPTYISQLETGKGNPSLVVILEIANQLDVSIIDLLRGSALSESEAIIEELKATLNNVDPVQKDKITTVIEGIIRAYK